MNLKVKSKKVKNKIKQAKKTHPILFLPFAFLLFTFFDFAQENLPDEIRGYKVYKAKISVNESESANRKDSEAIVKLGEPEPTDVSLSGVSFEIDAEISNLQQSGEIDFLSFKDFRIDEFPVEIDEYRNSFEIAKNKSVRLPQPLEITISFPAALRGVLRERREAKEFWQVTGRIFVFGHFKKGFFKFKRVIPIDINLQIKNPLREKGQAARDNGEQFLSFIPQALRPVAGNF